jgi:hypothetical protein
VLNGLTARNTQFLESTSLALFGQLSWKVTDAFTIQPGARLNYDKKRGFYERRVFTGTGTELTGRETDARSRAQLAVFQPQVSAPEDTDWNLTYDLTLSYELAPDVLAYGTYAKSFKTIGINQNGLPTDASGQPIADAGSIRPEKVDHLEIGLKTQFWDRRATLNLAAYRTDIRDYQATVINGEFGVLRGFLANADKVRSRGIEADFSVRPSERFDVSPDLISTVTDAVLEEVAAWQARPLDQAYPLVFFDAIRVKIRDEGMVRNKAIHIALRNSGTGKTHVALALGLAACQKGFTTAFTTAAALVSQLLEARDERRLLKLQRDLASVKLPIIDELGTSHCHRPAPSCCSRPSPSATNAARQSSHRTCRSRTGPRCWAPND